MLRTSVILGLVLLLGDAAGTQRYTPPSGDAGRVDFAVSCLPESLAHVERGVALLHSFWYEESRKAFAAAVDIDPDCAMAWWGQAMTWTHPLWDAPTPEELERGRTAARAARDIGGPTPREQAYIDAVQRLYEDDGPTLHAQRMLRYADAMDALAKGFPDDKNAVAFHALAVLGLRGGSEQVNARRAAEILVRTFGDTPDHPGAAHYLIHASDNPFDAGKALAAADKYPSLAPGIPHALHMPSHIYTRLGLWDKAVRANEAAWRASEVHATASDGPRDYHSFLWLHYGYLQMGRRRSAADVLAIMRTHAAADQQDDARSSAREGPDSRVFLAEMSARDAVERGDWTAAMNVPEGGTAPVMLAMRWYARGLGAARALPLGGQGPTASLAQEAVAALDVLAAEEGRHGLAEVQRLGVLAAVAAAQEEQDEMTVLFTQATALEDAIANPGQPTAPIVPIHELAGELWLQVRRYPEASREFTAALSRYPKRARAMYGLAVARARQGDAAEARRAYEAFLDMWSQADDDLPQLAEARQYLRRTPSRPRSK